MKTSSHSSSLLDFSSTIVSEEELTCSKLRCPFAIALALPYRATLINTNPEETFSPSASRICAVGCGHHSRGDDGEGIVRVGGRLENASVPYLHKHPAILPKGSKLSNFYCDLRVLESYINAHV
ncbi:hypothetical protein TNCV_232851 [Trichonephila clavipes]|nr:hypothetical protein TNCV_232851 [Trichonephila clavipes]